MIVLGLVVLVLTAGWAQAELRRVSAERERDRLRGDAIRLLLRIDDLSAHADRLLRSYHGEAPSWVAMSQEPWGEHVREAASAVDRAHHLAGEGRRLLDRREHHGGIAQQDRPRPPDR